MLTRSVLELNITDCALVDNEGGESGGGLRIQGYDTTALLTHVTISRNRCVHVCVGSL